MVVTTKDIAKICGVSRATVERALNDKAEIKKETKEKIMKIAKEMGYRPHLLARSLVKGKTKSLGVVIFDVRNRYFAQMLGAIETEAKKLGYFVYITLTEKDPEAERQLITNLLDRKVDGIILCAVNKGEEFDDFLSLLDIPVIGIGNYISENWPFVGMDDKKAIMDGVERIISKGYERIVFLCPPLVNRGKENLYAQEKRLEGFIESCKIHPAIEHLIIDYKKYENALDNILSESNKRTAIFCSSDIFALAVLKYLKRTGRKVPRDVGLMGFDNIDILEHISPSLTTIDNPVDKMGVRAVECLIDLIEGREIPKSQFLEHSIIEGESI